MNETTPLALSAAPLPSPHERTDKLGAFWLLWFGQSISLVGTQLVQFALGVWIYQKTGSVLSFASSTMASIIPALLVMPIAGSMVDNLNRRHVMIAADLAAAALSFGLFILSWRGDLQLEHVYIFMAMLSMIRAFQGPAYQASIGQIVPDHLLTRASGAMGISATSIGILTPALAGWMLVTIGLQGVLAVDLITFMIGTLFVWRAFSLARSSSQTKGNWVQAVKTSLENSIESAMFFNRRRDMLLLLSYTLLQVAMLTLVSSMLTPLILSKHPSSTLGVVLSCEAAGALVGSGLLVFIRQPRRPMMIVLAGDAMVAVCIVLAGLCESINGFCFLAAMAGMAGSLASSCAYALWMKNLPDSQRGGVLVVLSACSMLCTAATVGLGGLVTGLILEPAMSEGGILAPMLGPWIGTGKGRGVALMFVVGGSFGLIVALGGLGWRRLRDIH